LRVTTPEQRRHTWILWYVECIAKLSEPQATSTIIAEGLGFNCLDQHHPLPGDQLSQEVTRQRIQILEAIWGQPV